MLSAMLLFADTEQQSITLNHKGGGRSGSPVLDKPIVYYTIDDFYNQEVSINGAGYVSYYDVEISSASSGYVEISTVVNGTYDTIDVSSLPTGTHVITIESPTGNIYEGTFSTY